MDEFWAGVDRMLDRIEQEKPDTFAKVAAILQGMPAGTEPRAPYTRAFFPGSGGDRQLIEALNVAGWRRVWSEASYSYEARHRVTGHLLTYTEGDVDPGAARLGIDPGAPWWVMNAPVTRVLATHANRAAAEADAERWGAASFALYAPEYRQGVA